MEKESKKFKLGDLANWAGVVITFLTANWALVVSALLAIWASTGKFVFGLALNDHFRLAVQTFVIIFWTYVGIRFLASLGGTNNVRIVPDIRYAINLEGFAVGIDNDIPEAAFQLVINFRNMINNPIKIKIEHFNVSIGDRIGTNISESGSIVVPRVSARGFRSGLFHKDAIKQKNEGLMDLSVLYGDVDSDFTRRFRTKMKLHIIVTRDRAGKISSAQITDEFISADDDNI